MRFAWRNGKVKLTFSPTSLPFWSRSQKRRAQAQGATDKHGEWPNARRLGLRHAQFVRQPRNHRRINALHFGLIGFE